jgi:hypothetical protein
MGLERDLNFNLKTSNPRVLIDIVYNSVVDHKSRAIAWVLPDLPPFVRILSLTQYGKNDAYARDATNTFEVQYILFACSSTKETLGQVGGDDTYLRADRLVGDMVLNTISPVNSQHNFKASYWGS